MTTKLEPLVKWIGGKRKLAPKIIEHVPQEFSSYCEPFCGAAAMFAALWNEGRLVGKKVWLNDLNADVIAMLAQVRDDPEGLIEEMAALDEAYRAGEPEKLYYRIRDEWNLWPNGHTPSRFIFLKQTSFNGLWRVNRNGQLNAAWGKYAAPKICNEEQIREWSKALADVTLTSVDALTTWAGPQTPGALIYVDPPYLGTFEGYTDEGFDNFKQVALFQKLAAFQKEGHHVVMSNSVAAEGLVSVVWPGSTPIRLQTSYTVNRDGEGRAPVDELLVVHHAPIPERTRKRVGPAKVS